MFMQSARHCAGALVLLCALAACSATQPAAIAPASTAAPLSPASVCQDIAALQQAPDAAAQLNAVDEHSALGVIWAQVKSGCPGGVPAAGVNPSWTQALWAMTKQVIPQVLPQLVPLLLTLVKAEHIPAVAG